MRQRLATLFVDIAGSTRLLVHHPPETVLGVVQCFMTLVTQVVSAHDGRVKDFEGDGVLLYFGSARRAAQAALAIRAALDRDRCDTACEGGPGAGARMSITIGDVAVGTIGSSGHPTLASRFRLLDAAMEVPGADGLTVAVYALADPALAQFR